jgi:signal transduction histidine kinase
MLDRIESATSRQRTFVGDAAHELRSPLASLRVQLEVAQRIGPDTDWPELIDEVLIDVDRLDRLVEDLLALARLDETGAGSAEHEPVDLGPLVTAIVQNYEHARVPVVAAVGDNDVDHVVVLASRDSLHRVVVNLVDNAVRYARTEVRVDVAADGVTARLTVTDDGPGLPEAELERVFDRFYRSETSRSRDSGGTGLGLPIVRDLLRAHNGSVRLLARADGTPGLTALVELPRER